MPAADSKVGLYPDMKVSHNEYPLPVSDKKCRTFFNKPYIHSNRNDPFWGW